MNDVSPLAARFAGPARSVLAFTSRRPAAAAATSLIAVALLGFAVVNSGSASAKASNAASAAIDEALPVPTIVQSTVPPPTPSTTPSTLAPTTTVLSKRPAMDGDIDGDGKRDTIVVTPGNPTVRVNMTLLGSQTFTFTDMSSYSLTESRLPELAGAVDADADGHAEIFVQTNQGASTGTLSMLKLVNGKLAQVTLDNAPLELYFSGSMGHLAGFSCGADAFKVFGTYTADGNAGEGPYVGDTTSYKFDGAKLVKTSSKTETYDYSDQKKFGSYDRIDCGSLVAPAPR